MGVIYSAGMSCNKFDVAPNHGRTKFLVDVPHEGDNIDSENPRLNELTALYYLWKNEHNVGYKGLEHYRRAIWDRTGTHLLEPDEIESILKDYDVILTDKYVFFQGTMDRYCLPKNDYTHHIERMNDCWNGFGDFYWNWICTHYPSEHSWCNIFVANEEVADEYCQMAFDLVFNLKQPEGTKRFFAYCTEKLFSPWSAFKGLKVYHGRIHVYSEKPASAGY